ncbi:MAG: glucose-6-phosphate isomerase [Sulfurospirillum sp.]|nr:glucose-6-phosphate isomerase [Sulfurospirillum sp.]MBL0702510.1 glucose-6-phosphate isomerase [Sulfurospirillum sp.]
MTNRLFFNIKPEFGVFETICKEKKSIGYYNLPEQNLDYLEEYKKDFNSKNREIEHLVIMGIGGSSLGLKAIYRTLKSKKDFTKKIHFLESTDPIAIKTELKKVNFKKTHFFMISKSGTTTETTAIYKYILGLLKEKKISEDYRFTYITDKGSLLEEHAKSKKSFCLYIPKNVGGRFSVLSAVGLTPLSLIEVDIKALLHGAKQIKNSFFENGYIKEILLEKATYYAKNSMKYNINTLFAYSESFKYFIEWYVQLWGESLGKKQLKSSFNVGLTPVGIIGPKDQHSFLQLIVDGLRDKSVTVLKIKNFNYDISIPDINLEKLESMNSINGLSFNSLINFQADSIIETLVNKGDIPVDTIELECINEENLGKFIFYYELLTSLVAQMIGVDAYGQPGVEESKIILKKKLQNRGLS